MAKLQLRQPYDLWRTMHRSHNASTRFKVRHATFWHALVHCVRLKICYPKDAWRYPYVCLWTDDFREGEIGPSHWHVGRVPGFARTEEKQ